MKTSWLRAGVMTLTLLVTVAAGYSYWRVVAGGGGLNILEIVSIPLFMLLFGWIAFSFLLATVGWLRLTIGRNPNDDLGNRDDSLDVLGSEESSRSLTPRSRAAVLMPVYNESPDRVFAGVAAMLRSLERQGGSDTFDFYVLSDTTDHEVWLREEHAWSQISETFPEARVFYRHRPQNKSRKAGNIADFCSRWGSHYPYMIVLDADSLLEGSTMIDLVRRMDADERLGILQVPPTPIGRHSLFARIQQFSAAAYGRVFVEGFSAWAGSQGNYWGHNAIIRVEPFLKHCDLPILPGRAPLGGEILSHDFVEAALMLRAGWKVELATDLGGSYEECPPTLADYATRDQRWCQGNMQHSRLVISENFHPLSRFHFSSGVMAYAASPIWIAFTLLCIMGTVLDRSVAGREAINSETVVSPLAGAIALFAISMAMLLLPKFFALASISSDSKTCSRFGGAAKLWAGGFVEIVISILLSPIMALFHTRFVLATLLGTNVKWGAQQRDEHGVGWGEATNQFLTFTLLGCIALLSIVTWAPELLVWFSPLLAGLVLSIPLAVAMGSGSLGRRLRHWGLLLIPEEVSTPTIAKDQAEALGKTQLAALVERPTLFETVIRDPAFHLLHTHIQLATGGDKELSTNQSKAIEAAFAAGGPNQIPVEVRSALLGDLKTLRALHLESQ